MREKWIRLWRDFRFPLLVAFGTMPIGLVLYARCAPVLLPYIWLWPLAYVLLDALSTRIPGKWRIPYGAFEVLLLGASGWWGWMQTGDAKVLVLPGMYCVMLLWGLVLAAEERNERINVIWYVISIGAHLTAQLLQYSATVLENPDLDPVRPWNLITFFCFAMMTLITLNQANLTFATNGRQSASRLMQRKNLLLVFGFFGAGLLAVCIPGLVKGASELFRWIIIGIMWLMYILSGEENTQQGGVEGQGSEDSILPGADEIRQTPMWLNVILTVIVLILVTVVLGYLLYQFGKKLVIFFRYLTRISGKYLHAVSEDYVDEITDTREGREDEAKARNRKKRLSALDERKLSPEQRVRYRYLRLLQKHPEWDSGATAREKLSALAAPIYERARYSPHPVTDAEADAFAADIKKS